MWLALGTADSVSAAAEVYADSLKPPVTALSLAGRISQSAYFLRLLEQPTSALPGRPRLEPVGASLQIRFGRIILAEVNDPDTGETAGERFTEKSPIPDAAIT
jgi:hypothetical protein